MVLILSEMTSLDCFEQPSEEDLPRRDVILGTNVPVSVIEFWSSASRALSQCRDYANNVVAYGKHGLKCII